MDRAALHRDLVRLAEGDRDAFHPVFAQLWPVVRSFCARHLASADAADAAQEALIRVFARAAEFDAGRDAAVWALGIAAWQVRTVRRQHQRRREDPLQAGASEPHVGASAEEAVLSRELDELLGQLSERDAETLRRWACDEPQPLPPATFRKRVQRALARLRAFLGVSHAGR